MPTPNIDAAHDILRQKKHPLDVFFKPRTVAVIGATETVGSVGRDLLWNLISSPFGGTVYPVNPKRASVLGIKAYPSIAAVPEKVDLAVIITPAKSVPGLVSECVDVGIKGSVIISAGFKEIGPAGVELERQVMEQARRGNMRIVGPNCLGVMCPVSGLNASFAPAMARTGSVGFISQSGALMAAILDWSLQTNVGFSAFLSIGSMLDVNWGDLISYLGDDPRTTSIVIYMESIGDAQSFLSAAREVALTKPIIVIKAGRSAAAAKAAASHTGSLAGSDAVLDAAFRRSGVLRVDSISDLFYMAEVLGKQPRPKGPRLTILTNAGGPGVLATDALIAGGGELAQISDETITEMNAFLPAAWSHANPVDVLGDAPAERYAKAVELAAKDPNSDGVLVVLTPQAMTDSTQTAEHLKPYAQVGKPVLASWMGGADVAAGVSILNRAGIPTFSYPDTAARAFNYMWRYAYNLRALYETPSIPEQTETNIADHARATEVIAKARKEGREILTETESKLVLASYGIPVVKTVIASTEEQAIKEAEGMGFPVVLKIYSETITHKTDVGGVKLNLNNAQAVRDAYRAIETSVAEKVGKEHFQGVTVQQMIKMKDAYEVILGSSLDVQFGPVMLFGSGGQLVEVYKDSALALPPLNTTLARRLMEQTLIHKALKGVRGRKPVDLDALEQLIVNFSNLIVEQRWVKELDINPLLVSEEGMVALDARVVVHGPDVTEASLPPLPIRPYPTQYVAPWKLTAGEPITIRPIRPEDEPLMVNFHQTLSEESVYFRYFHLLKLSQRIAHERLTRICFNDYNREIALVAEHLNPDTGTREILAVGRLSKQYGLNEAEFAVLVSDKWQRQGLGTELVQRMLKIGKDEKLGRIVADVLPENYGMLRICEKLNFDVERADDVYKVKIEL